MQRRMWRRGPDGEIVRAAPDPQESSGEGSGVPPSPRRAQLGIALRLGLRDTYDHLGALLLLSLVWSLLSGGAFLAGASLAAGILRELPPRLAGLLSTLAGLGGLVALGSPLTAGL